MSAGPEPSCGAVRAALSRLALGERLAAGALPVARHVRDCGRCDAFVDALADVRRWLDRAPRPRARRVAPRELRSLAVGALTDELAARLARDLLAEVRGLPGRGPTAVRGDAARLTALHGTTLWSREPWTSLATHLEGVGPRTPSARLALAARLDPLGLDLALGWLGALERRGRGRDAARLADRLLLHVG